MIRQRLLVSRSDPVKHGHEYMPETVDFLRDIGHLGEFRDMSMRRDPLGYRLVDHEYAKHNYSGHHDEIEYYNDYIYQQQPFEYVVEVDDEDEDDDGEEEDDEGEGDGKEDKLGMGSMEGDWEEEGEVAPVNPPKRKRGRPRKVKQKVVAKESEEPDMYSDEGDESSQQGSIQQEDEESQFQSFYDGEDEMEE
eukprot:TRINITY_DN304_c1_g1_i5.p3 TRINITY_DN304_c1_g1~~TRINITY_DN304_c1_g1_i5.p3  ORF type:complete len:193 (-),score=50.08 TRINITY_DN304_c1_g1_i5:404-982(-)